MVIILADYVATSFFEVSFGDRIAGLSGQFTAVSGLSIEFDYDVYNEGGSNYPRYFFKNVVPQTLNLQQGTVTTADSFAAWIDMVNRGKTVPLTGTVKLKDHTGQEKRSWTVQDAFPVKYVGPNLNSLTSELAVSSIELRHNGCL